jgi:hypothetical protein
MQPRTGVLTMRQATWQKIEVSPFWHSAYRAYRKLPDSVRAPLRALFSPEWTAATWLVRTAAHNQVVSGPFTGMKLDLSPVSSRHLLGYILGTQEIELRSVIERIVGRQYRTILNVGAADGYYAVGLALRSPQSRVVAFEALDDMRVPIESAARANNVSDRITIRGRCELLELREEVRAATKPVLVLMDIEGGEMELLNPDAVPELRGADVLVETHDMFVNGVTDTLLARFKDTHTIEQCTTRPRVLADFPAKFATAIPRLAPKLALDLMDERRPAAQQWLYMTAKSM